MTSHDNAPEELGQGDSLPNPWNYEPARKPRKSGFAVTGLMMSEKNGGQVWHESLNEKWLFQILEQTLNVWRYLTQVRVPIENSMQSRDRTYTADIWIIFHPPDDIEWRIPPLLIEVKPETKFESWARDNEEKIIAATKFATENFCDFMGIGGLETVRGRDEVADWMVQRSKAIEPSPFPLQGAVVALISCWEGITENDVVNRLRLYKFNELDIVLALKHLICEGVIEQVSKTHVHKYLKISNVSRFNISNEDKRNWRSVK